MSILRFLFVLALGLLVGCSKQADLPDITVRAASPGEFALFRAELGTRFPPDQLKDFGTATQELQLDAMNRNIPTVAGREEDMGRVANGRTVHTVTLLGWRARRNRLLREIAFMTGQVEHNLKLQQQTAASGTPESVLTHLHNAQDILARLQRDLTATEQRLIEWGAESK